MNKLILSLIVVLCMTTAAHAIPVLQIGAPGGPGEGTYADYQLSLTGPTEEDTAVTYGNTIFVAGAFDPNTSTLGGQSTGDDWSNFNWDGSFNGHGALLMATVTESNIGSLTVNGQGFIYSTDTYLDGFTTTNNHDPIKKPGKSYMFFDIGNFANLGTIYNFDDETGTGEGEVKELTISSSGYEWIHFDIFAIETTVNGSKIRSSIETDPRSKDVTWKDSTPVPEPGTLLLLGAGLIGAAAFGRKKFKN